MNENKNITEETSNTLVEPKVEKPKDLAKDLAEKKREIETMQEELEKQKKEAQRVNIEDHKHCLTCHKPMKNDKAHTQCVDCRPPPRRI